MTRKTAFFLTVIFLFTTQACTIQGLPYPTDTPDPNLITPDLEATREMAEAGMFPSETPVPPAMATTQSSPTPESDPTRTLPTGRPFQIPGQTLHLAFTVNGDLWYWEENQLPRQLTDRGDVYLASLSPDSSLIAYGTAPERGVRELWQVDTVSGLSKMLVDAETFQTLTKFPEDLTGAPLQLDWIPGTDLVVFSTGIITDWPTLPRWHEVVSVNIDSLTLTKLADLDSGGFITLSPDGSQIAILNPDLVSLVNPDGSGLRELFSYPHIMTESENWYYPPLVWTADGKALRLVLPPEMPMLERDKPTRLIHLNLNGTQRLLAEIQMAPALFFDPLLSIDGNQLLYMVPDSDDITGRGILTHARADGSQAAAYAEGEITPRAWSPDNKHFIFSKNTSTYLGQIGEDPVRLNGMNNLQEIEFIDPGRFLIATQTGEDWQLLLGGIDGSQFLIAESESQIDFDFVR